MRPVVSAQPRLLALDPLSGVFARNVYDFWRPLDRREALVDGKFSVECYLRWTAPSRTTVPRGTDAAVLTAHQSTRGWQRCSTTPPFRNNEYKAHAAAAAG